MLLKILLTLLLLPILFFEGFLAFQTIWGERILPKIYLGGISLSGKSQTEAREVLEKTINNFKTGRLKIKVADLVFEIPINDLAPEFEVEKTVKTAYSAGHSTNLAKNFLDTLNLTRKPVNLKIDFKINEAKIDEQLANLAQKFDTEIIESRLEVKGSKVEFVPGKAGQKFDRQTLKNQIFQNFSEIKAAPITAKISLIQPEIPEEIGPKVAATAAKFIGKKIILTSNEESLEVKDSEIVNLVSPSVNNDSFNLAPNREKVANFVKNLESSLNQEPVDAKFQFDGKKAIEFRPSVDGVKLDDQKTIQLIFEAITALENSPQANINLPISVTTAKVKTSDVNSLGIKELIGRGVSNFAGSAAERIHNIKLATSRINGTLIKPGEAFSFNTTIGEISTATGYTSAYIISKGRTILGEGGGVCQVSTTAFRAVANSGLEIVKRVAHAYRVRYYEQAGHPVGLDATIFVPTVDLRFRNDTANYILIQAYTKGPNLYFDFYGTSDGRTVQISKPVVTNVRPAPEPLYEPDPSLPAGVTKQIDFSAVGTTVEVKRFVKKDGQVLHSDVFKSDYRPWQAIFKVGTGT